MQQQVLRNKTDKVVFPYTTKTKDKSVKKVGRGGSLSHHGELIQGQFGTEETDRALVTIVTDMFKSRVKYYPQINAGKVTVTPSGKTKAQRTAELTLQTINEDYGGRIVLDSKTPEKFGLGSSTSDCIATSRAVADAFGVILRPETIARIVVQSETASDSIMYGSEAVMFRHRQGSILENFGGKIPHLMILGFNTDSNGVDTLAFPPAKYSLDEIEEFREMRALLRRAIVEQSASLIGIVATGSSRINQRKLPKKQFSELEIITKKTGAVGLQVAHSGTVVGLIYDPRQIDLINKLNHCENMLSEIGIRETWRFEVAHPYWEVKI